MNEYEIRKFVMERYGVRLPKNLRLLAVGNKVRAFVEHPEIKMKFSYPFLFARVSKSIKITTNAMQMFFEGATKNVVYLDKKMAMDFVRGFDVEIPNADADKGYVVVKWKHVLGCGFYDQPTLINNIPKHRILRRVNI